MEKVEINAFSDLLISVNSSLKYSHSYRPQLFSLHTNLNLFNVFVFQTLCASNSLFSVNKQTSHVLVCLYIAHGSINLTRNRTVYA